MRALVVGSALCLPLAVGAGVRDVETRASCPNGVTLVADLDLEARDFHVWEDFGFSQPGAHRFGTLHARNTSKAIAVFSTADALLSVDGQDTTRSYSSDIIGTPIIDVNGRDIQPGELLDVEVYWPAVNKEGGSTASLSCTAARTHG
jgi:hypothetical protein